MIVVYNRYIRLDASNPGMLVDIIDITVGEDNIPDWHYSYNDDLGIADEVRAGRAEWLADNEEPTYVEPEPTPEERLIAEREELLSLSAIELLALSEEERSTKITRFNEIK